MAKKDKKSKKVQDDDWENEIGESIPPANAAPIEENPAAEPADDEMMGGGLLGAIRKNRDKKGKKGKKQQDTSWEDELGETAPTKDDATPTEESEAPKPKEVTEIGEDDFAPKKGKKGGNNKNVESPAQTATPTNEAEEGGEIRVKSKKEKEKEKKEREKQRKKEQVSFTTGLGCQNGLLSGGGADTLGCLGCSQKGRPRGTSCSG